MRGNFEDGKIQDYTSLMIILPHIFLMLKDHKLQNVIYETFYAELNPRNFVWCMSRLID